MMITSIIMIINYTLLILKKKTCLIIEFNFKQLNYSVNYQFYYTRNSNFIVRSVCFNSDFSFLFKNENFFIIILHCRLDYIFLKIFLFLQHKNCMISFGFPSFQSFFTITYDYLAKMNYYHYYYNYYYYYLIFKYPHFNYVYEFIIVIFEFSALKQNYEKYHFFIYAKYY